MNNQKLAVVDLGTNTFHLVIANNANARFEIEHREKFAVRLGAGGINSSYIGHDARQRAKTTLHTIEEKLNEYHISNPHIFATSAIRTATNREEVLLMVEDILGSKVRILSGEEEARFIYEGVKTALDLGEENSLIMDIGGGSVEFVIGNNKEISWLRSFEIGAQRLLDLFHKNDPILKEEIASINKYLEEQLSELKEALNHYLPRDLVGSSGTFDTLSEIYQIHSDLIQDGPELPITLLAFEEIHRDLLAKDRNQRLATPGMIEMRVDMIVVASILIHHIVSNFAFGRMRVSSYALKEGLVSSLFNGNNDLLQ